MRFLALLGSIAILLAVIYFSLLQWGLQRTHLEFSNTLLQQETPWILVPWDLPLAEDHQLGTLMIWVDIARDPSGQLRLVSGKRSLNVLAEKIRPEEMRIPFAELFNRAPADFLLINIRSNVENIDIQVNSEIPEKWSERVLLQSEYEPVLKQLHDSRPMIAMGTSAADRLRMLTYESLRLLPAAPFSRDVYVTSLTMNENHAVSKDLVNEVHRRKRRVIIGPLQSAEEVRRTQALGPDGYYVVSEEALKAINDNR